MFGVSVDFRGLGLSFEKILSAEQEGFGRLTSERRNRRLAEARVERESKRLYEAGHPSPLAPERSHRVSNINSHFKID